MGVIESIRGVMWARRNQPEDVAYVLGAAGQATSSISIGTGVTGLVHRYNPVVVAQQLATLEAMFPGRAFLGVGSSEAMNEVPAGMDWPGTGEQLRRTEEALEIISRLLDGGVVDYEGEFFRTRGARIYLTTRRRPPVYMSAFHEQAAEVAGRLTDGVWTLPDPRIAPKVIASYRRGADLAGRPPGEIILQGLASVAGSDEEALEVSREWKPSLDQGVYTDDIHEPADIQSLGDGVSDRSFTSGSLISADPDVHVSKLGLMKQLGATAIVLVNASGDDPEAMIRLYGDQVLPRMRDSA